MLLGALFPKLQVPALCYKFHVESQLLAIKLYGGILYGRIFYSVEQKYQIHLKDATTAHIMKVDFTFVIRQYKPVATDVLNSWKHVPLFEYGSFGQLYSSLPKDARLVGI